MSTYRVQHSLRERRVGFTPVRIKPSDFNAHGRHRRWLLRACLWLMNSCGITRREAHETIATIEADVGGILERLWAAQQNMDRVYFERARYVIVGHDAMRDLVRGDVNRVVSFDAEARLGGNQGMRVFGLKVVLVPWIEGVFLLPEIAS